MSAFSVCKSLEMHKLGYRRAYSGFPSPQVVPYMANRLHGIQESSLGDQLPIRPVQREQDQRASFKMHEWKGSRCDTPFSRLEQGPETALLL